MSGPSAKSRVMTTVSGSGSGVLPSWLTVTVQGSPTSSAVTVICPSCFSELSSLAAAAFTRIVAFPEPSLGEKVKPSPVEVAVQAASVVTVTEAEAPAAAPSVSFSGETVSVADGWPPFPPSGLPSLLSSLLHAGASIRRSAASRAVRALPANRKDFIFIIV